MQIDNFIERYLDLAVSRGADMPILLIIGDQENLMVKIVGKRLRVDVADA